MSLSVTKLYWATKKTGRKDLSRLFYMANWLCLGYVTSFAELFQIARVCMFSLRTIKLFWFIDVLESKLTL